MTSMIEQLEQELEDIEDDDRTDAKAIAQVRALIHFAREHEEMMRILTMIAIPAGPEDTPAHMLAFRVLSKLAEANRKMEKEK